MDSGTESPASNHPLTTVKLKRACDECWKKKVKCDMNKPKCSQCLDGNRECKYDRPASRPGMKKGYVPLLESRVRLLENELKDISSQREDSPSLLVDRLLLGYFFNYVNCYLGVFHVGTFMANISDQPPSLLYIMYALGLLYYQLETVESFDFALTDHYFKSSQSKLKMDENVSITSCLTQLLTTYYCFLRGTEVALSISETLVIRQAYILGLHKPAIEHISSREREVRSRLWWAIYCLDRKMIIMQSDIPSQMSAHSYPVPLPISDSKFNLLTDDGRIETNRSTRGHLIVLMAIYGRIADSKKAHRPNSNTILEASLMDWHNVAKDSIMDVDISIDSLQTSDPENWMIIFTKQMYFSAYLYLYEREFPEICQFPVFSPIQNKIFQSCISCARSIASIISFMRNSNPNNIYADPFSPFCRYMAGSIFTSLKNSPFHSNFVSYQADYDAILDSLKDEAKFSKYADRLCKKLVLE